MKPTTDFCINPYAENADYEISPLELVQDVSVLILEGRLPEFSSDGRCEGKHCWPVSLKSKKPCCRSNKYNESSMCNFVQSARRRMRSIWTESIPAFIEVLVCLDSLFPIGPSNKEPCEVFLDYLPQSEVGRILLLERWKMDVHRKESNSSSSSFVNMNMFLQAVRSFLHFSQLSAWMIKTGGRIPSRIYYRMIHGEPDGELEFNSTPEIHIFPQALTSRTESIELTLFSLPRLELDTLISMSPYKEFTIMKHLSKKRLQKSRDEGISCKKSLFLESEETPTSGGKCGTIETRKYDVVYIAVPPLKAKLKAVKALHDDVTSSLRKKLIFDTPEKKNSDSSSNRFGAGSLNLIGQRKQKALLLQTKDSSEERDSYCKSKENLRHDLEGSDLNGSKSNGSESNENYSRDGESIGSSTNTEQSKAFCISDEDDNNTADNCDDNSSCNGSHCNGSGSQSYGFGSQSYGFESQSNGFGSRSNGFGSHCNGSGSNHSNGFTKSTSTGQEVSPNGSCLASPNNNNKFYQFDVTSSQKFSESEKIAPSSGVSPGSDFQEASNGSGKSLSNLSLCENVTNGSCTDREQSQDPEVTCKSVDPARSQSCKSLTNLDKSACERLRRSESYCGARPRPASLAAKLSLGASTVPVFHPKTGLPVASSPAPLRKPDVVKPTETKNGLTPSVAIGKARKLSSEWIPQMKTLSKSAPASTRLLGNFEESVLKGRMPVFGTVEGFSAGIGASGSFCPPHITCPVKAHFFRTSDDNAPSPYLGHIALRNAKGKKGYHVPRKGTVQLTLFNPNNTVVKVFFVLYDFSDMPSNSHTFLRQKIVSVKKEADYMMEQQTLHYLVHLRFASTKHDRIYLHTDIRLIFPQQSPDVTSSKLKVLTNGPLEPKYTPRDR